MQEPQNKSVRHWLTFATGLVECLCFAGAVFGWASLVFVLKEERYFSSLCVNATGLNGTQTLGEFYLLWIESFIYCSAQDEQFSLVFTIASFMNNFLTLPNGFLFDRFGTTVARLYGIFLYTMGTLMVGFSSSPLSALAYLLFPALSFLAVGGILFLMTNMQVGNLFGSRRSTIITLYNGAFDSSSALFLVIKLLHESGVSLRAAFLFLSACSVVHVLRTFFLLPRNFIPYPLPDRYTYGISYFKEFMKTRVFFSNLSHILRRVSCGKSVTASAEVAANGDVLPATEGTPLKRDAPVNQGPAFNKCLLSRFFMWHLLWLSVMQLRHYLFIGTLNPMLQRLTGGEPLLVSRYTNAFAITQLCGVLCAPWNGLIMDRHKGKPRAEDENMSATTFSKNLKIKSWETEQEADLRATVLSLFLTALQCVLFSLCASTPYLPLQYFTFILQVLNRSFLYGGNAAFISVAFPSCHFGKLYGLVMALSAVFSLLQYPCFALVKGPLGGDPLYVNVGLTLLSVVAFIHPVYVYMHCRNLASERARSKASS
uniref:Solute carrier family 43 member 3b n=1 Tax=Poecilia formosa TaxID=48698 RepID=A0A096M9Q5_POEFO